MSMQAARNQFDENVRRARDVADLANGLQASASAPPDVSDLFRAALVAAVSAMDHFVHELARKGMLEIAAGARAPTDAYHRFAISMSSVELLLASPGRLSIIDDEIRERHAWLSFQDPSKIADALRLVCAKDLWSEIGSVLGVSNKDAKARLKLVIDRRNQIAHEADMDPTLPGTRWLIDFTMVDAAINVVEETASAIFKVVTSP